MRDIFLCVFLRLVITKKYLAIAKKYLGCQAANRLLICCRFAADLLQICCCRFAGIRKLKKSQKITKNTQKTQKKTQKNPRNF